MPGSPGAARVTNLFGRNLSTALLAACCLTMATAVMAEPESGTRFDRARKSLEPSDFQGEGAARRAMNKFARCFANQKPDKAVAILALPYLSAEQDAAINGAMGIFEECIGIGDRQMRFPPPAMIGGMAEELILTRYRNLDVARLAPFLALETEPAGLAPRTRSEDFAHCMVQKDAATIRALIETGPASAQEGALIARLIPHLGPCVPAGENLKLNKAAVRSVVALGLYRAFAALAPQLTAARQD